MVTIAIDASRAAAAQRTGTEAYSLHLIRALLALGAERRSARFTLYCRDTPPPDLFDLHAERAALSVIPAPRLWTHVRFAAALFRDRPDVTFVPAHTLPLAFPGPGVVTVHDLGFRHFPEAHPTVARLYLDLTTKHSARRARAILADSACTRRDLTAFYGIDAAKVHVVYPGVDPALAPVHDAAALAEVREHYGIPGPYLLHVGSLQPRKNLARLIEAYAAWLPDAAPQRYLVLAGARGWLYDDIFATVRRLGLEAWVCFPGYVDDAHLAALYSGADAFVFPSLYEGFGFPVLEAMRCRTPVICANTSSLPEVAGEAALLVDPLEVGALTNALRRLTTDAALRAALVAQGEKQAARFTWERAAQQALDILEAAARPR
ncbi:MAG: glycosyltransferase family 1 protein [Anaerolineae bacterium]